MPFDLFGKGARYYDLHTPRDHYKNDHAFILEHLLALGRRARVLDLGCGTGAFVEKALKQGIAAEGIDSSPEMVAAASAKLDHRHIRAARMEDLEEIDVYASIVSLSWSFNYCASLDSASEILRRCFRALQAGGLLVLQVAHAENATGKLQKDSEPGPSGEPGDAEFFFRFTKEQSEPSTLRAEYAFACRSLNELLYEVHFLRAADAHIVHRLALAVGFVEGRVYNSFHGDPFHDAISPFLFLEKPR